MCEVAISAKFKKLPLPRGEGGPAGPGEGGTMPSLTDRARELRRAETLAEKIAWNLLRDRRALNLKFRRQEPLGNYVVDFYCHKLRLVVELDGEVHSQPSIVKRDARRKAALERLGFRVLCVPNGLVLQDPDGFLARVAEFIPSPGLRPPSPVGRGSLRAGNQ